MDTTHPNHALISSEDVEGTAVFDHADKQIGSVDHLMIDKISGRVIYAVLSFGGFLGLNHSHYPLPWAKLRFDREVNGFRTDITAQQLRDAPDFSDNGYSDRNWDKKVHAYYDTAMMWGP
jgi:hypothetical protein